MVTFRPILPWGTGPLLCEDEPGTANRIVDALDHLAAEGPGLGRPMVDRIHRSVLHNPKELRPGSAGRSEVRMLFVFDADREAVVLAAGDKAGQWSRWYEENIPVAEQRYERYVSGKERGGAR
ncbi:type II toxin-antitoxin system RelE/ParE family toxin [Streptomyces xanthophaeus]|uniref:type II toxin-antitoxin system RelE/ParE family toxin n=1 Tax=Streptomyces xanthophaeus TaxID=67385 RepID=UPI00398FE0C4